MLQEILSIMTGIHVIGSQRVTRQSSDLRSNSQRFFVAKFVYG